MSTDPGSITDVIRTIAEWPRSHGAATVPTTGTVLPWYAETAALFPDLAADFETRRGWPSTAPTEAPRHSATRDPATGRFTKVPHGATAIEESA